MVTSSCTAVQVAQPSAPVELSTWFRAGGELSQEQDRAHSCSGRALPGDDAEISLAFEDAPDGQLRAVPAACAAAQTGAGCPRRGAGAGGLQHGALRWCRRSRWRSVDGSEWFTSRCLREDGDNALPVAEQPDDIEMVLGL